MSPSSSLEGRVCILLYMIGDEDGYDDDDDGDDVMIILPSPLLVKLAPYMLKICMIFT